MIADINFSYCNNIYNTTNDNNDLLESISLSIGEGLINSESGINTDFCYEDSIDFVSGFSADISDLESNSIVKDVFSNIREEHNIDLSQDPIVVETLRSLLSI